MNSLRSLVISTNLPYPTWGGMDIRNWQNVNALMQFGQVAVFGLCSNDPRLDKMPDAGMAFWCCTTDPVLAYPPPRQKLNSRAWLVEPMGHPSDMYYSDIAASEIKNLIYRFKAQLVVLEGLWVCRYIEVLRHLNCRIVLDSHNVEGAAIQEIASSVTDHDLPSKIIRNVLPERTRIAEQKASQAVNQVWVCSSEDASLMKEKYDISTPIHVVPNAVDIEYYSEVRTGKIGRPHGVSPRTYTIIFPGSFRWEPNAKAAAFLIEEIIPRVAKTYPDCRLLLVGRDPTGQMSAAAKEDPHILVTGAAPAA